MSLSLHFSVVIKKNVICGVKWYISKVTLQNWGVFCILINYLAIIEVLFFVLAMPRHYKRQLGSRAYRNFSDGQVANASIWSKSTAPRKVPDKYGISKMILNRHVRGDILKNMVDPLCSIQKKKRVHRPRQRMGISPH